MTFTKLLIKNYKSSTKVNTEQMTIHTPGGFEEFHEASKMFPRYRIRMLHKAMGKTYKGEHFLESLNFSKKMSMFNSQRLTILHYQLITIKKQKRDNNGGNNCSRFL